MALPRMIVGSDGSGPVILEAGTQRLLATVAPGPWPDNGHAFARALVAAPAMLAALEVGVRWMEQAGAHAPETMELMRLAIREARQG